MIRAGSKFGIHRPPVGMSIASNVTVLPPYVPTPPNQTCCVPAGSKENQPRNALLLGRISRKMPCPLCAGSYQEPVMVGPTTPGIGAPPYTSALSRAIVVKV